MVKLLNKQIGRGHWTTVGRPVRKLRRAERLAAICMFGISPVNVTFVVPKEFEDIGTFLSLGGEK